MFLYQITNLPSYQPGDRVRYPIRRSGKVFIKVPQSRMSQEMRRIARSGGKIVSIQPLHNTASVARNPLGVEVSQEDSSVHSQEVKQNSSGLCSRENN